MTPSSGWPPRRRRSSSHVVGGASGSRPGRGDSAPCCRPSGRRSGTAGRATICPSNSVSCAVRVGRDVGGVEDLLVGQRAARPSRGPATRYPAQLYQRSGPLSDWHAVVCVWTHVPVSYSGRLDRDVRVLGLEGRDHLVHPGLDAGRLEVAEPPQLERDVRRPRRRRTSSPGRPPTPRPPRPSSAAVVSAASSRLRRRGGRPPRPRSTPPRWPRPLPTRPRPRRRSPTAVGARQRLFVVVTAGGREGRQHHDEQHGAEAPPTRFHSRSSCFGLLSRPGSTSDRRRW